MLRVIGGWARRVHEGGIDNARGAATDASRRRVEVAEIEAYLVGRYGETIPGRRSAVNHG